MLGGSGGPHMPSLRSCSSMRGVPWRKGVAVSERSDMESRGGHITIAASALAIGVLILSTVAISRALERREGVSESELSGAAADIQVAYSGRGALNLSVVREGYSSSDRSVVLAQTAVSPSFSPDGQQVAFVMSEKDNSDIYAADVDGTNLRPITSTPYEDETGPAWSSDGSALAFERTDARGLTQIVVRDVLTGREQEITSNEFSNAGPTWSPDGEWIVFFRNFGDQSDLVRYDLDSRTETQLTSTAEVSESAPAISPDATRVAFLAYDFAEESTAGAESVHRRIELLYFDGQRQALPELGDVLNPDWVGADKIAFARVDVDGISVAITNDRGEDPTLLVSGLKFSAFDVRSSE